MISTGPVIGIDRGASYTDFAVVEHNELVETRSIESRDWRRISDVYRHLKKSHKTTRSVFTGAGGGMPKDLAKEVSIVAEIDAVGFGGAALARLDDCLVVSIGTGTAMVHFNQKRALHVGGTGVGGGTIRGLASLLCGTEDPVEVETMARQGNAGRLNLTISDLGYKAVSFLGSEVTASNFAAVKSSRKEDLAAGIVSLVGETVGIIASLCAREAGCSQAIVTVGKVAGSSCIRRVLELVGKLYRSTFIFPENPGFATAFGAVVNHSHRPMPSSNGRQPPSKT